MTRHRPTPPLHSPASPGELTRNDLAFAVADPEPLTPGHTLVLPVRPLTSWSEATAEEQAAILSLIRKVEQQLSQGIEHPTGGRRRPAGFTVGFDLGEASGQTHPGLHVHVVPRYAEEGAGPPPGLRRLLMPREDLLHCSSRLATGGERDPFARHVLPLFDLASEVAILAAFVKESGLERIEDAIQRALARGARVRLLTGDYLDITEPSALERLLDWEATARIETQDEENPEEIHELRGTFAARIFETATLPGPTRAFHPKSWRFEHEQWGLAFVGSSNLSRSALDSGIEWNLGITREREPETFALLRHSFEELWAGARPLEARWVAEYAARPRNQALPLPPGEVEAELSEQLPEPNPVQQAALAALQAARAAGRRRALVVMATGLGKTLVAVLDHARLGEELGRRPRLLFLAHRRELLAQAAATLRRLARARDPGLRIGWCSEGRECVDVPLRPGVLQRGASRGGGAEQATGSAARMVRPDRGRASPTWPG